MGPASLRAFSRTLFVVAVVASPLTGCTEQNPGPGADASPGFITPPGGLAGTVVGTVISTRDSQPVANALVRLGTTEVLTDERGRFRLQNVAPGERLAVHVERDGFVEAIEPVTVQSGQAAPLDIALVAVTASRRFMVAEGAEVKDPMTGASAVFPPNALVGADGKPATGAVQAVLAALDPTQPEQMRGFPGDFTAVDRSGNETLLETVVPMAVTARAGNEILQIAAGQKVAVTFPVPAALVASAPETIPLWSLDPATGGWREEGVAVRQPDRNAPSGFVYHGEVPHLSWWNCDKPITTRTCVRGCVRNSAGQPVAGARITAAGVTYTGQTSAMTGSDGCFALDVKRSEKIAVTACSTQGSSPPSTFMSSDTIMSVMAGPRMSSGGATSGAAGSTAADGTPDASATPRRAEGQTGTVSAAACQDLGVITVAADVACNAMLPVMLPTSPGPDVRDAGMGTVRPPVTGDADAGPLAPPDGGSPGGCKDQPTTCGPTGGACCPGSGCGSAPSPGGAGVSCSCPEGRWVCQTMPGPPPPLDAGTCTPTRLCAPAEPCCSGMICESTSYGVCRCGTDGRLLCESRPAPIDAPVSSADAGVCSSKCGATGPAPGPCCPGAYCPYPNGVCRCTAEGVWLCEGGGSFADAGTTSPIDAVSGADGGTAATSCGGVVCPMGMFCSQGMCVPSDNAAVSFSASMNPKGNWSYGSSPTRGGPFSLFTVAYQDPPPDSVVGWRGADTAGGNVFYNPTDFVLHPAGTSSLSPRRLAFHPGSTGQNAIVRWTAPSAGAFMVSARFMGISGYNGTPLTTVDVAVLRNSETVWTGYVNLMGATNMATYGGVISVNAGDTINFAVGYGNGSYSYDGTSLDAMISAAP